MRSRGGLPLLLLALVAALPRPATGAPPGRVAPGGASCPAQPAGDEQVVEVTPGRRYDASGLHRLVFGADYRQVWTTPVRVPVLDLRRYDGGLAPLEKGGGKQSLSLKLESRDGREYRFRSIDKDPTKLLPRALRGTIAGSVLQDQTSSSLPAASLVVGPLLDRVGVKNAPTRLMVMGDDDSLGGFRQEFAGMLGTLEEVPRGGARATPGFEDVAQVLSSEELFERQLKHPQEHVDTAAFLRARLVDLLVGDWDRHAGQWRWGRSRESGLWLPIPRDRDQAFSRFEGLALGVARVWAPRLVVYGPRYPALEGLVWNSRDLDRRLLPPLSWADWQREITAVQVRLDDEAVAQAVCRLPAEHYRLLGAQLLAALVERRRRLPAAAREFYELLSDQVDVFATQAEDVTLVERRRDGSVRVRISAPGAPRPWFERVFDPRETREVRLYLEGGDDRLTSSGGGPDRVKVRVIGGPGDDVLDDSAGGRLRLYDSSGDNALREGPGTRVDTRGWVPPIDDPDSRPLDWGGDTTLLPWASYYQDVGALVGAGMQFRSYGFRQYPYAHSHTLRLGYATRAGSWRAEYLGDFRRRGALEPRGELTAIASGFEVLRFYGFGNEHPAPGPDERYQVAQRQYLLAPSIVRPLAGGNLTVGPLLRYAQTDLRPEQYITTLQPYGVGRFGQLGVRAGFRLDRRDRPDAARKGVLLTSAASVYPALWSVERTFGELRGSLASYLPLPLDASLALRAGGQQLFGRYPFHEAAFIGSWDTVRGLPQNRYAGERSLFANAELRLPLTGLDLFYSGRLGVFALADVGRVYLEGEPSRRWHSSFGGGGWLAFENGRCTFSVAVARSEGDFGFYLYGGLLF